MGKKYKSSLAAKVSGTVQRAFDPYSRGSNQCYPQGKRPAGARFISNPDEFYKSLADFHDAKSRGKPGNPLLYIVFLVYLILFLPLVMCFRDSLLGGVYILAALASYYQLEGKGRIVFMSVLGCLFYWWCLTRALWGPNNDILNTLEALNCRGLIKLLKRFSIRRGNPFTGLVTRTNYINTTTRSVGFNCSERRKLSMDHSSLKSDKLEFPGLQVRIRFEKDITTSVVVFEPLSEDIREEVFEKDDTVSEEDDTVSADIPEEVFEKDDTVSADIPKEVYGMITIEAGDEVLTDYNQLLIFQRIQAYFTFMSYNPDNLTCSEAIGNEMGIPCAHAISLREIMDHFAGSSGIFQMKFDKEILVK